MRQNDVDNFQMINVIIKTPRDLVSTRDVFIFKAKNLLCRDG